MDPTTIPMSGNAQTLIDISKTTIHITVPAELNGLMQNSFHNDIVENGGPKQHAGEDGMEQHDVRHGHGNHGSKVNKYPINSSVSYAANRYGRSPRTNTNNLA